MLTRSAAGGPASGPQASAPTGSTPAWLTNLLGEGATVVDDEAGGAVAGGSSRDTVLVELPAPAGDQGQRVVARHDRSGGPLSGTPFNLAREAATYDAVARAGIVVPAVRAVAPDGSAYAVDLVPGQPSRGAEALDDYLAALGRLHAAGLNARPAGHPGFDADGAEDLAMWEHIATTRIRRPAPLVSLALDALNRHGARQPIEVVVCHGDAGLGNYLYDDDTVTGLVDWELAHTGDPHDDLASVAVRAALAGVDLGDYTATIKRAYEPVAGIRFDRWRQRRGVVAVLTRMVISCRAALDNRDPGTDVSVQLLGLPIMELQLLRGLARLEGHPLPEPDPAATAPDLGFAAEIAQLTAERLGHDLLPLVRRGPAGPTARRLRYAVAQLAASLASDHPVADGSGSDPAQLADLVEAVAGRLAVLPASWPLAVAPIAGVAVADGDQDAHEEPDRDGAGGQRC